MTEYLLKGNTQRFSHTADAYEKFRPSYPQQLFDFMQNQKVLTKDTMVADIGSGTGIFSQLLLPHAKHVYAVEPNDEMRLVAERNCAQYTNFSSIAAAAENTGLQDSAVDLITVATAFHWFDRQQCRQEFARILSSSGWVALIWNLRLPELSAVTRGYENILRTYCADYQGIPSQQIAEKELREFFVADLTVETFANHQYLSLPGFIGRLRSTSYALQPDQLGYDAMINDMQQLFMTEEQDGVVNFPYQTKIYLGKIKA